MFTTIEGAVLLGFLAIVASLTALLYSDRLRDRLRSGARSILGELSAAMRVRRLHSCSELGTIAIVYSARNNNGLLVLANATPLTAIQASQVQKITGLLSFAVGDGLALFTHNWGLDASSVSYYEPEIICVPASVAGGSFVPCITFGRISGNVFQIGIPAGTAGTFEITARRPHSVGQ